MDFILTSLLSIMLSGFGPSALGSGFLNYSQGASAAAMGGAYIAYANDPTAVFYNPAGIAFLDGTQVSLGTSMVTFRSTLGLPNWPDSKYRSVHNEEKWDYHSSFYISHRFGNRVSFGFGYFSPYGASIEWPEDYPLRYASISDSSKTYVFNPVIAVKLNERVSAAIGLSYIDSKVSREQALLFDFTETGAASSSFVAQSSYEVDGKVWGLNAGALYREKDFSLGLNWRGGYQIEYEGNLNVQSSDVRIPPPLNPNLILPESSSISFSYNYPHIFGAGAWFNLAEKLTAAIDVHYVLWSALDQGSIDFDDPFFTDFSVEYDWRDSFQFMGGMEYRLSEKLVLRTGISYFQTPQPAEDVHPGLPDGDSWVFSGGLGYKAGKFVLDLAYQFASLRERKSPNRNLLIDHSTGVNLGEGTYSSNGHYLGINLGYLF